MSPKPTPKSPRERAARALCRLANNPEDTRYVGKPMWQSYLPDVDAVLEAALSPDEWARIRSGDNF